MPTVIRGSLSSNEVHKELTAERQGSLAVSDGTKQALRRVEEQLIAEIARCEQDMRRGAEDLARLKDALRSLRRKKRADDDAPPPEAVPGVRRRADRSMTSRSSKSAAGTIRNFVRKELRAAGRPLNRVEILERLNAAGIKIESKVPAKRIGKVLWSCDEFQHVGDGYWFAGESIPSLADQNGPPTRPR